MVDKDRACVEAQSNRKLVSEYVEKLRLTTKKVQYYENLLILNKLHLETARRERDRFRMLSSKGITNLSPSNTGSVSQMIQVRIARIAKLEADRKHHLEQLSKFETEVERLS